MASISQITIPDTNSNFHITKMDDEKKQAFGWANVAVRVDGEVIQDWQDDIVEIADLENAAYNFVRLYRAGGEMHQRSDVATLIESVVFTKEKVSALGLPEGSLPEGWWIGFQVLDDDVWAKVKSGEYSMFSIEGDAIRQEVDDIKKLKNHFTFLENMSIMCGTFEKGGPGSGRYPKGSGKQYSKGDYVKAIKNRVTGDGVKIKSLHPHALDQAIKRGIYPNSIVKALKGKGKNSNQDQNRNIYSDGKTKVIVQKSNGMLITVIYKGGKK